MARKPIAELSIVSILQLAFGVDDSRLPTPITAKVRIE